MTSEARAIVEGVISYTHGDRKAADGLHNLIPFFRHFGISTAAVEMHEGRWQFGVDEHEAERLRKVVGWVKAAAKMDAARAAEFVASVIGYSQAAKGGAK